MKRFRLAVLGSHPIQYFAPLYRRLSATENLDLTVYYCSRQGVDAYQDVELGISVKWDVPLLDGYDYRFLTDLKGHVPPTFQRRMLHPTIFGEIVRNDYDALWIYGYQHPTYLLAILAAKVSGTSLLIRGDTHLRLDRLRKRTLKNAVRRPALRLSLRLFDGALAIGSWNAQHYLEHGMPEDRVFLMPYAVDNNLFMSHNRWNETEVRIAKQELGIPTNMPVVLFVGKFTPNKDPLTLLEAFHRVQEQVETPVALVLVGDGELRADLEDYCYENQIENVVFAGFVNQSRISRCYAVSDILVLLSKQEAWGLVVNEAMCAKNAIIVSDAVGAAADLVLPDENGFTFPVGGVDVLTAHLARLVSDSALCRRMGERSLDIIKRWSFEEDVLAIQQALSTLCQ